MEECSVLLPTYTWTDMMKDLSGLRRYANDTKQEMAIGTSSIKLYGPTGSAMEFIPHPMMKSGEAKVQPFKRLKRIGSSDITFKIPGATGQNENMFQDLPDNAGAQLRCYADQALVPTQPAKFVNITGIVNSSLPDAATEY
jgi:hypothetical protein